MRVRGGGGDGGEVGMGCVGGADLAKDRGEVRSEEGMAKRGSEERTSHHGQSDSIMILSRGSCLTHSTFSGVLSEQLRSERIRLGEVKELISKLGFTRCSSGLTSAQSLRRLMGSASSSLT